MRVRVHKRTVGIGMVAIAAAMPALIATIYLTTPTRAQAQSK